MALFGKKKKEAKGEASTSVSDSPFDDAATEASALPPAQEVPTTPAVPVAPKPIARPDVYTLLLGLSVVALIIACVLLFLNIQAYGPNPMSGIPRP